MRGCELLRELEKKVMVFDFRYARSLPLDPTNTSRVTGSSRNLHGGATECQGGCCLSSRKPWRKNSTAADSAKLRRHALRHTRPQSANPQTACSGRADPTRGPRCAGSANDVRGHRGEPTW